MTEKDDADQTRQYIYHLPCQCMIWPYPGSNVERQPVAMVRFFLGEDNFLVHQAVLSRLIFAIGVSHDDELNYTWIQQHRPELAQTISKLQESTDVVVARLATQYVHRPTKDDTSLLNMDAYTPEFVKGRTTSSANSSDNRPGLSRHLHQSPRHKARRLG